MFSKIKSEWEKHKWQIVPTIVLVFFSLLLGFIGQWGVGYGLLGLILLYDFCLMHFDKQTITKWARRQLSGWLDKILMVILWALVVKYAASGDGWGAGYWFMVGTINGHINWEK